MGRNCNFLHGSDSKQPALVELRAAINEGRASTVLLRNYLKDGTLFYNELDLSPIYDSQGNLSNFIGIQKDVTDRVKVEEARQMLSRE